MINNLATVTEAVENNEYITDNFGLHEIYVAQNGSDNNSGDINSPLKNLSTAIIKARAYKDKKTVIYIREGIYNVNNTINLTYSDARSASAPLVISAYENENVKFEGAVEIDRKNKVDISEEIFDRLPSNSKYKIEAVDLKKCGITSIDAIPDNLSAFYDVQLYSDDVEMNVATWPNGDDFANFGFLQGNTNKFIYKENNPDLWGNAKDAYVQGFFEYDYTAGINKISNIDVQNKTIELSGANVCKNFAEQSARYKVYNLIEELDMPGEWYIDRASMILYFYPIGNENLKLATLNSYMLDIQNCSNIIIKDIDFSKSRKTAINIQNNSQSVILDRCNFYNLSMYGVRIYGTTVSDLRFGEYDPNWAYLRYMYNGCKNCEITNCTFTNIGSTAIKICGGGNPDLVECGENKIHNNIFSHNSTKHITDAVVELNGIGDYFENNFVNNQTGQVVFHSGAKNKIRYNEIENVLNAVQDAGAIYCGRSILARGSEIAYNIVRDTLPKSDDIYPHNRAIYYDDEISGQICHHNILVNGDKAITYGGSSGTIYSNTIVNFNRGLDINGYGYAWKDTQSKKYLIWKYSHASNKKILSWDKFSSTRGTVSESAYSAWNNEFPEILQEAKYAQKDDVESRNVNVYDNLSVNANNYIASYIPQRDGSDENNTAVSQFSDFCDAENNDYRIKNNSNILKTNNTLITEDFDLSAIGVDTSKFNKLGDMKSFEKKFVSVTDDNKTMLAWTESLGADSYYVMVSSDEDMNNILFEGETADIMMECDIDAKDGFYWTVTAVNKSSLIGNSISTDKYKENPIAEFNDFALKDKDNNDILSIQGNNGKEIYLNEHINSNLSDMVYVFAVYDGEKLISVDIVKHNINNGINTTKTVLPDNIDKNSKLKIFRFSSLENMKPLKKLQIF